MSQPAAVSSASLARGSPRCQAWSSLPRFPSGCSRLWSGPATKPSSEIDMWQVVSGIRVLQVIAICKRRHRTAHFQDSVRLFSADCGGALTTRGETPERETPRLRGLHPGVDGCPNAAGMGDPGLEPGTSSLSEKRSDRLS